MTTDARWAGSMPEIYERCLGPTFFAPFAAELAGVAATWQPRRVLEVAAGTGILTRALVRALPQAEITATDLNAAMVEYGSARVPAVSWQQADAQRLPFEDDRFDMVASQFGVMFFPDKPAAFAEARRVLTAGGRLLFAVWDTIARSPLAAAVGEALAAVFPDDVPDFFTRIPHGYTDVARIDADLRIGGLVPESVERVVLCGSAPSASTLADGFCLGSPLRFELERRGELDGLREDVAEHIARVLGPGRVSGDLTAIVVSATKPAG